MTKNIKLILVLLALGFCTEVSAQLVHFTGVGRALFSTENFTDKSNEASELKASGGYTMMDLGIYATPDEVLHANVILRQRNEFGGFFDNGTSLEFRQFQLEGLISKKVKYEIGDIYVSHTPYTIWNDETTFSDFESDLFKIRRDIAFYENFIIDNNWRMQGVNAKTRITNFEKGIESVGIRAYAGRTRSTDFSTIPDRYYYGGRLDLEQSKNFTVAANLAAISDIVGTVDAASVDYDNAVYSLDFNYLFEKDDKFSLAVKGEAGGSYFSLSREEDSVTNTFSDYFYDFGGEANYKPLNLLVGVSYRYVGHNFNSPMAQTRRVAAPGDISLTYFPTLNDDASVRPFTLFDRFAQENTMYNQSISTTLMNYMIQYDMVEPYGQATPNRKGLTMNAKIKDSKNYFSASLEYDMLSEVVSEGDSLTKETRKFSKLQGGAIVNVHEMLGFKKMIMLTAGVQLENSSREGTNAIDLGSSLIDVGVDLEVVKNLHLLGGAKLFSVKGTELQTGRDELNQIVAFSPVNFDESQSTLAVGLRYDYDKKAYFSMQGNFVNYEDGNSATSQFDLNQLFMVFGLKF